MGVVGAFFYARDGDIRVKYMRLGHKHELAMAVVYTVMVCAMSGYHVYHLIASSLVL